jgi:hypothetical protein
VVTAWREVVHRGWPTSSGGVLTVAPLAESLGGEYGREKGASGAVRGGQGGAVVQFGGSCLVVAGHELDLARQWRACCELRARALLPRRGRRAEEGEQWWARSVQERLSVHDARGGRAHGIGGDARRLGRVRCLAWSPRRPDVEHVAGDVVGSLGSSFGPSTG